MPLKSNAASSLVRLYESAPSTHLNVGFRQLSRRPSLSLCGHCLALAGVQARRLGLIAKLRETPWHVVMAQYPAGLCRLGASPSSFQRNSAFLILSLSTKLRNLTLPSCPP